MVREAGRFGCICPGLTLWFLSSLEEGERSHQTVPLPQTGFGQRQKVWCDARGSPITTDHLLVPFSTYADALLSQIQSSKTCVALCFPSVGTSRVILKCEGWVMEIVPTGSDSEWVLMSVLFWFQLTGPCLGEVPTVQSARKEVKRRKKQTDSGEEYGGRGRGRGGRGQGEHDPLQGLSRTSPKPAANDFFFFFFSFPIPSCFGLLPPWQLYKATD